MIEICGKLDKSNTQAFDLSNFPHISMILSDPQQSIISTYEV